MHDHFHFDDNKAESVFLEAKPELFEIENADDIKAYYDRFLVLRKDVMKAFINFRKNVPEKYQKTQIKEILVEEVMSDNPLSISKNASISEVANTMMDTGYNGLPVVEDNNVIGIITQTDILRLIAKLES